MSRPRSIVCLMIICGLVLPVRPATSAEPTKNSALAYWQAFAQLPTVEKDLAALVSKASSVTLDSRTRDLLRRCKGAFYSMRRAASMPECDWGLELSAGPHAVMPHLAKSRQMARYQCLLARHQIADGQHEQALGTIRDTFIMARRLGADDVLISVLVQHSIEQLMTETICQELPQFTAKQLRILTNDLDKLPQGGTLTGSLKLEQRVWVGWARGVLKQSESDAEAARQLASIAVLGDQAPAALKSVTREQIGKWLDGTWKDYDELQAIFDLPREQFDARWKALVARIKKNNPFSAVVLPGLESIRQARDRNTARRALFRAAVAIQRDGADQLASHADPFGDGPFAYQKTAGGFRISSRLLHQGKSVTLTVGPNSTD